jgi:very-short-patch-repair endonuclease
MVPLIDSARRVGHVSMSDLWKLCATRRPGVRVLAAAAALSDPRAESAWESLLRLFHHVVGIDVQPQVDVVDDRGHLLGRVDLLVTGTRFVHEYDGQHHRAGPQHQTDLRRDRGFAGSEYTRSGFTSDDLLAHPHVTLAEIDRKLGRRHRPSRIRRWLALVAESAYSEMGRDRLRNRWYRQMGVPAWLGDTG